MGVQEPPPQPDLVNPLYKMTKSRRIKLFGAFLIFNIIAFLAGAFTALDYDTAQGIVNEIAPLIENPTLSLLLGNNLSISLTGFIPIIGVFSMIYVLYSTGLAFSAVATVYGVPSLILILSTFITPSFWLEFIAYSLAMMEGTMIFLTLLTSRNRIRQELVIAVFVLGLVTLLLAIGALIEAWMIGTL
jgi:hypothetical protein